MSQEISVSTCTYMYPPIPITCIYKDKGPPRVLITPNCPPPPFPPSPFFPPPPVTDPLSYTPESIGVGYTYPWCGTNSEQLVVVGCAPNHTLSLVVVARLHSATHRPTRCLAREYLFTIRYHHHHRSRSEWSLTGLDRFVVVSQFDPMTANPTFVCGPCVVPIP